MKQIIDAAENYNQWFLTRILINLGANYFTETMHVNTFYKQIFLKKDKSMLYKR